MPMPNCIIKWVDQIRLGEKQGWEFRFLNRSWEPYKWTDTVPEDNPNFPGITAKIPGVPLVEEDDDIQVVTNKPKPVFETLAAAALDNAGINRGNQLQVARATADVVNAGAAKAAPQNQPRLVEAYKDKTMYNITID
jgi:hypothetical protein